MPRDSKVQKTCQVCNKDFKVRKYRENTAKFCSLYCQNVLQYKTRQVKYTCLGCQKDFTDSPCRGRKKFCSMECKTAIAQDSKERRKKQRYARLNSRGTNSSRLLRKIIFSTRKPECQSCGYNEHTYCIDLHHIDENPNNNVESNIAILCVICHRKLHKGDLENAVERGFIKKDNLRKHQQTEKRKLQA